MAAIKIDTFSGIIPRAYPTLLPDGCAVKANNCRLKSGKLSPIRNASKVTTIRTYLEGGLQKIGDAKTLYMWHRYGGDVFLAWENIVKVAQSNLADDVLHRIFVTGATGIGTTGQNLPCVYIENATGTSFVRHPLTKTVLAAPVLTAPVTPSDPANIRYTRFFQTWVDAYGYESGVSDASEEVQYTDGDEIGLDALAAPTGAVARRIYKVVSGTETESIQFIIEDAVSTSTFPAITDLAIKDEDAGEILPKIVSPPEDLSWMTYVPGNFYVGYSPSNPRTVRFSDVDRPYSWPLDYAYDVHEDIVGLTVVGNTVFVMTEGYPEAFTGTAPESMTPSVLASPQACVSSRSICVLDGGAFYVSKDGICMLSSATMSSIPIISEKYFSKREWEALNPETCLMDTYDGALMAWFTLDSGVRQGYIFDIREGASALMTHDEEAKAIFYDVRSDNLYYVREI
jgi:hypothetical protein